MKGLRRYVAELATSRVDGVVAAATAVALELELRSWLTPAAAVTMSAAILFAAPIAVRRRWPAGALVFSSAVVPIEAALGGHLSAANGIIVPPVLLAYGAGAWLDARRGLWATIGAGSLFGGLVLTTPTPTSAGDVGGALFFLGLLFAAPWFIGRRVHGTGSRAAAFRALAERAAAEGEERERAAIASERARIGHELQDVIAHSVSAMIVQAGGARRLLRSDPERARGSILTVEQTGREVLADLRRLLGMLRKDDDPRALAPQPGLDQVTALIVSLSGEGLHCELRSEGVPVALTPGVDLVGYRIIESALRRAVHNGTRQTSITVRYRPERLELEIRGDGWIVPEELDGIGERVALYDGSLRALPSDDSGFALLARLPLGVVAAA
jgi:signal transduction histidine kinase